MSTCTVPQCVPYTYRTCKCWRYCEN